MLPKTKGHPTTGTKREVKGEDEVRRQPRGVESGKALQRWLPHQQEERALQAGGRESRFEVGLREWGALAELDGQIRTRLGRPQQSRTEESRALGWRGPTVHPCRTHGPWSQSSLICCEASAR